MLHQRMVLNLKVYTRIIASFLHSVFLFHLHHNKQSLHQHSVVPFPTGIQSAYCRLQPSPILVSNKSDHLHCKFFFNSLTVPLSRSHTPLSLPPLYSQSSVGSIFHGRRSQFSRSVFDRQSTSFAGKIMLTVAHYSTSSFLSNISCLLALVSWPRWLVRNGLPARRSPILELTGPNVD